MLSAGARVLAAKTDCAENRPLWLPLWMHARDTVGITECLLDEFVSDALADNAGLSRDELVTVARFIAFNHDTGKICASFASSICGGHGELLGRLEHYGIILPERRWFMNARSTPHALAGEVIVRYYGCNATVAAVIGAHHGVPTQNAEVVEQALDAPPRDAVCMRRGYR